jgi:hypothetical protein
MFGDIDYEPSNAFPAVPIEDQVEALYYAEREGKVCTLSHLKKKPSNGRVASPPHAECWTTYRNTLTTEQNCCEHPIVGFSELSKAEMRTVCCT